MPMLWHRLTGWPLTMEFQGNQSTYHFCFCLCPLAFCFLPTQTHHSPKTIRVMQFNFDFNPICPIAHRCIYLCFKNSNMQIGLCKSVVSLASVFGVVTVTVTFQFKWYMNTWRNAAGARARCVQRNYIV